MFLYKLKKIDENEDENEFKKMFTSNTSNSLKYHIKNFLKGLDKGRLKDISNFYFKYLDVSNIDCLEEYLGDYSDYFVDDNFEFDQEYYDLYIDRELPGFKELIGLVSSLNDKIKKENRYESDSDSDNDSDSEDYKNELNNFLKFISSSNRDSDSD